MKGNYDVYLCKDSSFDASKVRAFIGRPFSKDVRSEFYDVWQEFNASYQARVYHENGVFREIIMTRRSDGKVLHVRNLAECG